MILLYHGIVPDSDHKVRWCAGQAIPFSSFQMHIRWLSRRYRILSLADYLVNLQKPAKSNPNAIAITFDDGMRSAFQCAAPFLQSARIPATFFVTTGHLERGELLWFNYLNALCFEMPDQAITINKNTYYLGTIAQRKKARYSLNLMARNSGDPVTFCRKIAEKYHLQPSVLDLYGGMTYEQLAYAGKTELIELGGHTVTHPYLDQLDNDASFREIVKGKHILSDICGKSIRYFAYPGGAYSKNTIKLVKDAGYKAGFAIIANNLDNDWRFEVERVGIYSSSLFKLQMKVFGVARIARRLGLRVG